MHRVLIACLVTSVWLAQCHAQPASDKAARRAFEPLYAQIRKAFLNRDIEAFMALFAPAGTARQGEKPAKQDEVRVRVGMVFAMLKKMTGMKLRIQQVKVNGDRALVVSPYAYQGIVEPQPGKRVKMADRGTMKTTWARTPKGWRILAIDVEGSNPTLDGKPMQGAMQPPPLKPGGASAPRK